MDSSNYLQTEFNFVLPKGFVDAEGKSHRHGSMRLSTAKDEICVAKNPLVRQDPIYAVFIILSRVITRLGDIQTITPELLENLFARDLAYLREFYNRINQTENASIDVKCPQCSNNFNVEFVLSGE